MIDFTNCQSSNLYYGGSAGRKLGIVYEGENYLLKFPGNLKEKGFKNIQLSYSNSPIAEYIGSHIYESVGIDVHNTLLGTYQLREGKEKVVCACKDFTSIDEQLIEFGKLKVTFEPHFLDSNGNETNGTGTDLIDTLKTIEEHPVLKDMKGVKERFWDMFIMDAFIGNADRNNGNWGVLMSRDGKKRLAPVFDNGNCLFNKWDEAKMQLFLSSSEKLENIAYTVTVCVFELKDRVINPFQFLSKTENESCLAELRKIVPKINLNKINEIVDSTPYISNIQKELFQNVMQMRLQNRLLPALERANELGEKTKIQKQHKKDI